MEGAGLHLHAPHTEATDADGVNSVRDLDIQDVQMTRHLKTVQHGTTSWNIYKSDKVNEEGLVKLGREKNSLYAKPNKMCGFVNTLDANNTPVPPSSTTWSFVRFTDCRGGTPIINTKAYDIRRL